MHPLLWLQTLKLRNISIKGETSYHRVDLVLFHLKYYHPPLSFICLVGMNFLFVLILIWPCKHKMGDEGFVERH